MDLDEVADELYALLPEEFTAARNARAKTAKSDGDTGLADEIKALGKPTAAAWIANQLARQRAGDLEQLALLGEQMREASAGFDGARLRELTPQRHSAVDALVTEGIGLAGEADRKVSADVGQKLRETLDAALVDPAAAQAVRSGRLVSALRHVGFGVVDESGEPSNVVSLAPRRATKRRGTEARERDADAERVAKERREAAEREVAEAESLLDAAEARADDLATAADSLRERIETAQAEIDRLTAELAAAKQELADARSDNDRNQSDLKAATREVKVADRRSRTAADKLAGLDD